MSIRLLALTGLLALSSASFAQTTRDEIINEQVPPTPDSELNVYPEILAEDDRPLTEEEVPVEETSEEDSRRLSKNEVLSAIGGFTGRAARAAADLTEWSFNRFGRPSAVIIGSEAGAQLIAGYYKGSGRMIRKEGVVVEDEQPIHWNVPTLGLGGEVSGGGVLIFVYGDLERHNIHQDFVGVRGSAHAVVGGSVQYMRQRRRAFNGDALNIAYVNLGLGIGGNISVQSLSFTEKNCWFGSFFCR